MRSVALGFALLVSVTASAEPVSVGVDFGATAAQKAASHAPIFTPGLHVDVSLVPKLSLGFQTTVGRFGESNPGGELLTTQARFSATIDGRVYRQTLGVFGGLGPAVRVLSTRVTSQTGQFSGTRVRPGLRLRTGVTGDMGRRWQWGVGLGAVADSGGVDWDGLASFSVVLGRS